MEKVKANFGIETRSTGRGAYTNAMVIDPDGTVIEPDRVESSRTGNHGWKGWYGPLVDCLILVDDYSNSGKDNSYYILPQGELSESQEIDLRAFEDKHFISESNRADAPRNGAAE